MTPMIIIADINSYHQSLHNDITRLPWSNQEGHFCVYNRILCIPKLEQLIVVPLLSVVPTVPLSIELII